MTRVPWIFYLLCFALLTGDIGRSSQILTLTGDVVPVTSLYVSTLTGDVIPVTSLYVSTFSYVQ